MLLGAPGLTTRSKDATKRNSKKIPSDGFRGETRSFRTRTVTRIALSGDIPVSGNVLERRKGKWTKDTNIFMKS